MKAGSPHRGYLAASATPHALCLSLWLASAALLAAAPPVPDKGTLALESVPESRWHFGGVIAPRLTANIDQWLLCAPEANPAMLEMFRLRDRQPVPRLVPWAGEFAGKYLISSVEALRLTGREDLRSHTARFVAELIGTQAEDGYLGPFPRAERLLKHWDLWGHYHVMQGLLLWHDYSGDAAALAAVQHAADLICRTYLDGARRVLDAGSPEMNMAVAHVLGALYRRTGEARYRAMVEKIVKEWELAGDYLRTGIAGMPFYQTPRPRWESLHDLQALAELWRITGQAQYRDAFVSHWQTICRFDRRNTGAFSGGERATGNAFAPSAIETCCTVAWMALSCDMLRLTADPHVADELELSTLNAALGAQHPSGRWWTYNTPMDGQRMASAHEIVFQARPGSPELNCCSVNGPRPLGMLCDWAVMRDRQGLVLNWLGPMEATTSDVAGGRVTVRNDTTYPLEGHVTCRITSANPLRLRVRVPAWAEGATARLNDAPVPIKPGSYLEIQRTWRDADRLELELPLRLRAVEGRCEQAGKVSVYRGPLLLAYDQHDNAFDEKHIPALQPSQFPEAKRVSLRQPIDQISMPWLLLDVPTAKGVLRLRDFANAGSIGTRYRSWLYRTGDTAAIGPDAIVVAARLDGNVQPQFGRLLHAVHVASAENGTAIRVNGENALAVYALPATFGPDFSVAVRVRIRQWPAEKHIGQVFSAWTEPQDEPLRLTIEQGQLFARIETAGRTYSTSGVPLILNQWYHVAAVKSGRKVALYLDGVPVARADAPAVVETASRAFAVGGNPAYSGAEFLAADLANLCVRNRALSDSEVLALRSSVEPAKPHEKFNQ